MSGDILEHEFGSEVGMPEKTKFLGFESGGIIVWECPSKDTQNLKANDIFDELKYVPDEIRKYIKQVILSPFGHPDSTIEAFASACDILGVIIFYKNSTSREDLIDHLHEVGTLRHEAGHIMDRVIKFEPDKERFSHGSDWANAKRLDCTVRKQSRDFPIQWVLGQAEKYSKERSMEWALEEDFADSVRFFTGDVRFNNLLKKNYPHRYKIIKGILK